MEYTPESHIKRTAKLARALKRKDIYTWLVTKGYYPENYVLPPCFVVTAHPSFGKKYFKHTKRKFKPKISEYHQVHFPKTELTDKTFGIIDPELHSDISYTIAMNWKTILGCIFNKKNKVCSYSFPVPVDARNFGHIGGLRSGRMIYEFIEMAENDLASIAYNYKYLLKTDIKNFYPSIYTHSISWAIHGKKIIRKGTNRHNYTYFGNRLDKLFQNANDGCTNGVPIGPVVSDLIAEIVLSGVDRLMSKYLPDDVTVVRFKDDYSILAMNEADGRAVIKLLQSSLKEFRLELNDEKTEVYKLPNGLFRNWVSQYHTANPKPKAYYKFKRFKEVYLSVVTIDRENPGCGVIDRFLADITTKKYKLRIKLDSKTLPKVISLLLMLADLRIKAFPKVLAIIETILNTPFGSAQSDSIVKHLDMFLQKLSEREQDNRYLIAWICYFIRANKLESKLSQTYKYKDPVVRSTYTSRNALYKTCNDFKIFSGVKTVSRKVHLLEYLDVFKPQ